MSDERNWMDLPPELLHLISRKLPPDYLYFILFRAVCKTWRSSAPLSDPHPQLPWLLECSKRSSHETHLKEELRFYSLASGKIGTIDVQDPFSNKCPLSLVHLRNDESGFLLVVGGMNISVPFQKFPLIPYRVKDLQQVDSKKIDASYYNWPVIFDKMPTDKIMFIVSMIEHKLISNVTSYFVKSCGEILRVIQFHEDGNIYSEPLCYFHIYKLSKEGGQSCWIKVSDIGDQILFLECMNGFTMRAPTGFKGNCIYFILYSPGSVWRFHIATGIMEKVLCPFNTCRWIFPFN